MAGREELVHLVRLAEKAERYEEMVEFMEKVVAALPEAEELTVEERNLLSVAYKNEHLHPRAEYQEPRRWDRVTAIREYRAELESDLNSLCEGILRLLDTRLIPSATGDYLRYLAEFKTGDPRKDAAESALSAFKAAQDIAEEKLPPMHPIRLGLALNVSDFYFQILKSPEIACTLAEQAYEGALAELMACEGGLSHTKDSIPIMLLLRDNLSLWTADSSIKEAPQP
ncbi:unnamed protein product [Spirodela intermedia]|uniref:14-3-3 domain-containing protein n=1 Tax=Spirodela intermedia TaxID=51605 RepID=A0A7I8J4R8_SPIIN|nr:unnamed protein product [Spirodela intermedia]CAA6664380.1 unnamed protein product [Spirodela intermedia]